MSAESPTAEMVTDKLAELNLQLNPEMPYRLDSMFPRLKGFGSKSEIKTRVKLINQAEPKIDEILLENEEVLYVSRGVQNSILEALTIGAVWANMINQTLFVLTNVRLLMAHCNGKGKISQPCWVIYYSEIKTFKATFTGTIKLKLNDGKNLQFSGFPKSDRKAMPQIFESAVEKYRELGFTPQCSQSRENLCSECFTVVPQSSHTCSDCGATFHTTQGIALRSLIFPAWGDIVMKHYPLVAVELLGYAVTWFVAFGAIQNRDYVFAALLIGFAHIMDALVTLLVAKKGLHLKTAGANT